MSIDTYPTVSLLIPIRNPVPKVLDETLESVSNINYPKKQLQVLIGDDTNLDSTNNEITKNIVSNYNFTYFHDQQNKQFKAGMLNLLLKQTVGQYIMILDYDHILTKNIIKNCVAILEKNPQYSYVQSKVNFRNLKTTIQRWESVMYAQFFEVFARSKSKRGTVIFNGSTAIFRKKVFETINDIPTYSLTEDVAFTVELLGRGKQAGLLDQYGSLGLVPDDFSLMLSQIVRWAKGQIHVLKSKWKMILKSNLSFVDRIDLLFSISLFLVASTMYINSFFYGLMFLFNFDIIRAPIRNFLPLMIIPVAFSLSYQLSGIISVLFSNQDDAISLKIKDLIFFYFYALILNPYTVYAVFKSIFRNTPPHRDTDHWNEKVPIFWYSLGISLFGGLLVSLSILDYLSHNLAGSYWLVLGLLGCSMILTFPVSILLKLNSKTNNSIDELIQK